MAGETNLATLLRSMAPELNSGDFVFCTLPDLASIATADIICFLREQEGITIILEKERADALGLSYSFVAAWITLKVHSALEAVGLTAAFSKALAENSISCNVVAGYYHDHIFVAKEDATKAINVLQRLSLES